MSAKVWNAFSVLTISLCGARGFQVNLPGRLWLLYKACCNSLKYLSYIDTSPKGTEEHNEVKQVVNPPPFHLQKPYPGTSKPQYCKNDIKKRLLFIYLFSYYHLNVLIINPLVSLRLHTYTQVEFNTNITCDNLVEIPSLYDLFYRCELNKDE